jgi:hypothetical protein
MIVAILGGRLFDTDQNTISASIPQILESLDVVHRRHSMPEKEHAALELTSYVSRVIKPKHLIAADRLAIECALVRSNTLSQPPVPCHVPESSTSESELDRLYPHAQLNAEVQFKSRLGESLWAKLSQTAKSEFVHGEFYYIMASKAEVEHGDFNSFVMSFSRGLLSEIQQSLNGPLAKNPKLRGEFKNQFGLDWGKESPEWGEILRYMDSLHANAATEFGRALSKQRVRLDRLDDLRTPFEEMRDPRNHAAHTGRRIDREQAAALHDLVMNKGLLRNVVEFFPKPTPR